MLGGMPSKSQAVVDLEEKAESHETKLTSMQDLINDLTRKLQDLQDQLDLQQRNHVSALQLRDGKIQAQDGLITAQATEIKGHRTELDAANHAIQILTSASTVLAGAAPTMVLGTNGATFDQSQRARNVVDDLGKKYSKEF